MSSFLSYLAILEIPRESVGKVVTLRELGEFRILGEEGSRCWFELLTSSFSELFGTVGQIRNLVPEARISAAACEGVSVSVRRRMLKSLLDSQPHSFPLLVGRTLEQSLSGWDEDDFVDLGIVRFEDLLSPEPVFALVPKGAIRPRLEQIGLSLLDNNLPFVFDSFVGRDKELEGALDLLQKFPLVTIKGPGGIGKTRFGMHLAAATRHLGAEVVRFISLAEIHSDDQVEGQVLRSFKASGQKLGEILEIYRRKNLVLVLDNCEHVELGVRRLVQEILNELPLCRIIATSRHVLGLKGEAVFELDTLDLPEKDIDSLQKISETGSGELFLDRFEEQGSRSKLDEKDVTAIVSLLHLVDGVPLAIEHAAYQAALSGVQECWESLERSLLKLSGSETAYEPRHQTIRATLKWSLDLLSDEQRSVTETLAVFRGQFDSRDFRVLTGFSEETEKLWELYRRSIVRKSGVVDGRQYFQMTEAFRQFVLETVSKEVIDHVKERYAPRAFQMCIEARAASDGAAAMFDYVDEKLRYTMILCCLELGAAKKLTGAQLAIEAQVRYWLSFGGARDGLDLLAGSPWLLENSSELRQARALFLYLLGDLTAAASAMQKVLDRALQTGLKHELPRIYRNFGTIMATGGQLARAAELFDAGLKVCENQDQFEDMRLFVNNKARILLDLGKASDAYDELARLQTQFPYMRESALLLFAVNWLEACQSTGKPELAFDSTLRAVEVLETFGSMEQAPALLLRCAHLFAESNPDFAAEIFGASLVLYEKSPSTTIGRIRIEEQIRAFRTESWLQAEARGRAQDPATVFSRLRVALFELKAST
ncbi:MAG: hypothetical protein LCH41_06330 [Armatimonadetes bacterium]|nr:hypothetical protein [Armatimonadota bacterium]